MFYMDNRCQTDAVFLKFSIPICAWMYLVCKNILWTKCWIPREQPRIYWHQQCKDLPIVSYLFGLGKCSNVLQSAQNNILKNKALTVMTMTIVMMIMAILIKIIMTTYDDGSWEGNANTLLAWNHLPNLNESWTCSAFTLENGITSNLPPSHRTLKLMCCFFTCHPQKCLKVSHVFLSWLSVDIIIQVYF